MSEPESQDMTSSPVGNSSGELEPKRRWSRFGWPPRLRSILVFAIILVGAGALRIPGVTHAGVIFDDESWYVSDAQLWSRCAKAVLDPRAWRPALQGDKAALHKVMERHGVDFTHRYQKPSQGYTGLGALMMFMMGDGAGALLLLNAILGTASVGVLYLIVRAMGVGRWKGNLRHAAIASSILAVSPLHVLYSRSCMAEASAIFFELLAVLFWVIRVRTSERRWLIGSGVFAAAGITCHYRSAMVPLCLLACGIVARLTATAGQLRAAPSGVLVKNAIRSVLWFGLGAAVVFLVIEIPFWMASAYASVSESHWPEKTYWQSILRYAGAVRSTTDHHGGAGIHLNVWMEYGKHLLWLQGPAFAVTIALGAGLALFRRDAWSRFSIVWVLLIYAPLLCQPFPVMRGPSLAIPFLCIAASLALCAMSVWVERQGRGGFFAMILVWVVVVGPSLIGSLGLLERKSGIPALAAFFSDHPGQEIAAPLDGRKYSLALESSGGKVVDPRKLCPNASPEETLQCLRDRGVRWVIADAQPWHLGNTEGGQAQLRWWVAFCELLSREASVVLEQPHASVVDWAFLAEGWGSDRLEAFRESGSGRLYLYDVQDRHELHNHLGSPLVTPANWSGDLRPPA